MPQIVAVLELASNRDPGRPRAAEAALQVLWAAQSFHPERFADLDMGAETRHFYKFFYGLELTDDELARVLRGLPPADTQSSYRTGGTS